jgi:hypothetical protein
VAILTEFARFEIFSCHGANNLLEFALRTELAKLELGDPRRSQQFELTRMSVPDRGSANPRNRK